MTVTEPTPSESEPQTPSYGTMTRTGCLPYSAVELTGILDRDESVTTNRLAATVLNLLVRADNILTDAERVREFERSHQDQAKKSTKKG